MCLAETNRNSDVTSRKRCKIIIINDEFMFREQKWQRELPSRQSNSTLGNKEVPLLFLTTNHLRIIGIEIIRNSIKLFQTKADRVVISDIYDGHVTKERSSNKSSSS